MASQCKISAHYKMGREKEITAIRKKIEKLTSAKEDASEVAAALLAELSAIKDMDESLLRLTKIAFAVDRLRKSSAITDEAVKRSAKELLKSWQRLESKKAATGDEGGKKSSCGKKTAAAKAAAGVGAGFEDVERDAPIDFEITAAPPKRNKHGEEMS
jgi:hypothetical protein